jgi:hypothetical protein
VTLVVQGKHRYYSLCGLEVAATLEALSVLAGSSRKPFVPSTPEPLRAARACYDHIAGALGVCIHDRFTSLGWLSANARATSADTPSYDLTPKGARSLELLGIDISAARSQRRRFAFACVDWSERRPHLGGAVGAALLHLALKRRWLARDLDSRILNVTTLGRRELRSRLGLAL